MSFQREKAFSPCRMLVAADRDSKIAAISSLLNVCQNRQIRIIADSLETCKTLKIALQGPSSRPFFIDENGALPQRETNVIIAPRNCVAKPGFALESAEILVFWDASMLLEQGAPNLAAFVDGTVYKSHCANMPLRLDLSLLFNPVHPTRLPIASWVVGFLNKGSPEKVFQRLRKFFPAPPIRLGQNAVIDIPQEILCLKFLQKKTTNAALPGIEAPTFAIKKDFIWSNQRRNRFIAGILAVLQNKTTSLISPKLHKQLRKTCLKGSQGLLCGVICDNNAQSTNILQEYTNLISGDVSTGRNRIDFHILPSTGVLGLQEYGIIIRADAGAGTVPDAVLAPGQIIIDIADIALGAFDKQFAKRMGAYRRQGGRIKGTRPCGKSSYSIKRGR